MYWVKNNYDRPFVLRWGGEEYLLPAQDWQILKEDVVKAYFPNPDDLSVFLPTDSQLALRELRSLVEVFIRRWGMNQLNGLVKIGSPEQTIDSFFEFIEKFEITSERPSKVLEERISRLKRGRKRAEIEEEIENE